MRSTCRRPWERGHPCPHRILALRRKKRRKNRGGDITSIRLRRRFVLRSAGNPGRHALAPPARRDRQGPPRPTRPGRLRSARRPQAAQPRRVRAVEKSRTGCAGAVGGRASAQAHRWRVLVANQVSEWPFGSPWVRKGRTTKNRRPDRRTRLQVTASLSHGGQPWHGISRNYAHFPGILLPLSKCPRTVGRSRSASRRAPLAAVPVALRAPTAAANAK